MEKRELLFSFRLNKHHAFEDVWRSEGTTPCIANLSTRRTRAASFTTRPRFYPGKGLRYTQERRPGGPQSRCGSDGDEEKNFLAHTRNRTSVVEPVA
jgi:hypothetical protein